MEAVSAAKGVLQGGKSNGSGSKIGPYQQNPAKIDKNRQSMEMLTVGRRKKNGCVKSQNSVKHVFVYFILYILIYTVVGSESVDFEGT